MSKGTVVVTGAAQGIGEATARLFAAHGYDVALLDISESVVHVAREIDSTTGGSAVAYKCDVTSRDSVQAVASEVTESGTQVKVLVNNVGWSPNERFMEQTPEAWQKIIDINLVSVLLTTAAYVPAMAEGSAIVNVASDAGRVGVPKEAVYSAAKAAVIGFSKSMAVELSRSGIRVNVVSPGTTATPMVRKELTQAQIERRIAANPSRRFAEPSEVGEAIRWLACDAAYITGQILSINGGALRIG